MVVRVTDYRGHWSRLSLPNIFWNILFICKSPSSPMRGLDSFSQLPWSEVRDLTEAAAIKHTTGPGLQFRREWQEQAGAQGKASLARVAGIISASMATVWVLAGQWRPPPERPLLKCGLVPAPSDLPGGVSEPPDVMPRIQSYLE